MVERVNHHSSLGMGYFVWRSARSLSRRWGDGPFGNHVHRQRQHGADIRDIRRQHEGVARFGQFSELGDVLLRDTQLHRFVPAGDLRRLGDFAQPLGGCAGDGHNGGRRTFGLVNLLLLLRFRRFDDLLLLALRLIDGRIAFAFGGQNHRTFFPHVFPARRASAFPWRPGHLSAG